MCAVNREDLEVVSREVAHPARNVSGLPIPRRSHGIAEVDKTRFAFREIAKRTELDPRVFVRTVLQGGSQKIAKYRHRQNRADGSIQQQGQLKKKHAARVASTLVIRRELRRSGLIAW